MHRSYLKAEGFSDTIFDGRPVVGICNSWSELNNCNAHLRQLAEAVKRGVWSAGGFPLEFPVISLGEILMKPTTMLFRNLMAMDVEECIRAYPLDSVVLLAGCDKTTPAMLMGAASADVPAIMVKAQPGRDRRSVRAALVVQIELGHQRPVVALRLLVVVIIVVVVIVRITASRSARKLPSSSDETLTAATSRSSFTARRTRGRAPGWSRSPRSACLRSTPGHRGGRAGPARRTPGAPTRIRSPTRTSE